MEEQAIFEELIDALLEIVRDPEEKCENKIRAAKLIFERMPPEEEDAAPEGCTLRVVLEGEAAGFGA